MLALFSVLLNLFSSNIKKNTQAEENSWPEKFQLKH